MPIPTRATIKSYFETNDQPTQAQFAAFVDAVYDLSQDATDNADAAVAEVAVLAALLPTVIGSFKFTTTNATAPVGASTQYKIRGATFTVTNVGLQGTVIGGTTIYYAYRFQVDVVFDVAMAGTGYAANVDLFAKTTAGCSFYFDANLNPPQSTSAGLIRHATSTWFELHIWA